MKLEFLYRVRVELKKYNVLNIIGIGKKGKIIADSLTNSNDNTQVMYSVDVINEAINKSKKSLSHTIAMKE